MSSLALTRDDVRLISGLMAGKRIATKWNKYYSKVRFQTALTGTGPFTYTIAKGSQVTAFGYGQQDMAAGGQAGVVATLADTNLKVAGQTKAGEHVLVKGISCFLDPASDAHLAKQADTSISLQLVMNGQTIYVLGHPSSCPQAGGYYGRAESTIITPSPYDVLFQGVGAITNGMPIAGNYFELPEPILWASSGKGDSLFNIICTAEYAIANYANINTADRAAEPETTTFSGTNPWTHPAAAAVFLQYVFYLHGPTFTPTSINAG